MELLIILGLIMVFLGPSLLSRPIGSVITLSGFLLFLFSKVFLFRRGVWVSWGPKQLKTIGKWQYFAGYLLMVTGVIVFTVMKA